VPANCFADPKLGSISSLRCQKSRNAHPKGYNVRSDVFADDLFNAGSIHQSLYSPKPRRPSIPSGGARRDRTDDLMLAKHALSQLSYGPVPEDECFFALAFASATAQQPSFKRACRAEAARSSEGWWAWEDLNFRPHAYQARALTN
jgi:hypothetical protein